jgi:CBS domain containing-hemolysin-like protein
MTDFLWLILALLLVIVNGFFVAAEFSLVKLRQTRIRTIAKTKGWRGRILAKVHGHLDAYLSGCQLGITLASLGLGWIGEPAFAGLLEPLFNQLVITSAAVIHSAAFIVAFSIISFLHIVAGELAPKSLALRFPEAIGLAAAIPLYGFYWLMYPAIWLLTVSANLIITLMGLNQTETHDNTYSADELKLILRNNRRGRFTREEWNIMAKTLDFSELHVADLMRPVHEMVALYQNRSLQENLQIIAQSRYSRYPYFAPNNRDVLGIIHQKDLFFAHQEGKTVTDLSTLLRPVHYFSSHTSVLELLRYYRKGKPHFTIVGERGKAPQGFITFDNLLTAMVGEIKDEFRHAVNDWIRLHDGSLLTKGSLPIFSLERILGIDIENEELELDDVASISGLVLANLRDIPVENQSVDFNQFKLVVKKMDGARIDLVQIYPAEPKNES